MVHLSARGITTEMENHRGKIHIKEFPLCGEIAYIQNGMVGSYTAPGQELRNNAVKSSECVPLLSKLKTPL